MSFLIRGGRVIDPASDWDGPADVLIDEGVIRAVGTHVDGGRGATVPVPVPMPVINATGRWVVPGLIDLHTHLREPGAEYKETIETGTLAAVAGGFTTVCAMPNTQPVNDNQSVTEFILMAARKAARARVLPVGAITKGSQGEQLAEFGELKDAGCVAVSDDGRPVMKSEVMRRAMEYATTFGLLVIDHCEDLTLSDGGAMHEGAVATRLGLQGIPAAAEEVMVARNLALAELTGCRLHLAHLSTAGSVRLVREAKQRGVRVTAETCPHYFTLTDEAVVGYDPNTKMNPPLRTRLDVEAIKAGLKDGTIDAIATDHAPHAEEEKAVPFDAAPFGIIGLETAVPLTLALVAEGVLTAAQAIARLTVGPARVLGLDRGRLAVGAAADVTVIDPTATWVVEPDHLRSKSRNTPFKGWNLTGRVTTTIVGGRVVYGEGQG